MLAFVTFVHSFAALGPVILGSEFWISGWYCIIFLLYSVYIYM